MQKARRSVIGTLKKI